MVIVQTLTIIMIKALRRTHEATRIMRLMYTWKELESIRIKWRKEIEMRTVKIINNYVNEFNEKLDVNLKPIIKEDCYYRFPVSCNCFENTIIVWQELFEALTEEQKRKHVFYALSMLYAAEFYGKETVIDGHKARELLFNPNIIAEEVFKKEGLSFSPFEELQKEIYETKQRLYPYPDPRGSFF